MQIHLRMLDASEEQEDKGGTLVVPQDGSIFLPAWIWKKTFTLFFISLASSDMWGDFLCCRIFYKTEATNPILQKVFNVIINISMSFLFQVVLTWYFFFSICEKLFLITSTTEGYKSLTLLLSLSLFLSVSKWHKATI